MTGLYSTPSPPSNPTGLSNGNPALQLGDEERPLSSEPSEDSGC